MARVGAVERSGKAARQCESAFHRGQQLLPTCARALRRCLRLPREQEIRISIVAHLQAVCESSSGDPSRMTGNPWIVWKTKSPGTTRTASEATYSLRC